MDEIRLGTIGSGVIVHSILNHVKETEGIRLTAVFSRSEEKGRALAEEYGCNKVYTDMGKFLSDDHINTVYVATPNLLHYEQTKRALLAGKNVICEKPFVTRSDQAQELAGLAKEKHLFLVEAVPTTFLPNYKILVSKLPEIGRIRLVLSNYSQYSSRYDVLLKGGRPAIFDPQYGGGCLMDINFYNVYLNVALFGKPGMAVYYPNIFPGLSDTSGSMIMQYDGFVSQNAGAKDTWGVNFFQIEGEEGYIYIENGANGLAGIRVVTRASVEIWNEQESPDRWFYEVRELTRLMRNNCCEELYERLDITLDVVEVIEKARKAAGIWFPGEEREPM